LISDEWMHTPEAATRWFTCQTCGTQKFIVGTATLAVRFEGAGTKRRAVPTIEIRCQAGHDTTIAGAKTALPKETRTTPPISAKETGVNSVAKVSPAGGRRNSRSRTKTSAAAQA
jgi:hypothetical protein